MRRVRFRPAVLAAFATTLAVVASGVGASTSARAAAARPAATTTHDVSICKHARRARARCFAIRIDRVRHGRIRHAAGPAGYGPVDLQSAYSLPSTTRGDGETVAIVDAYDDPGAAADLVTYRAQFHLPACTAADGCFEKVDQTGGHHYPEADGGWAEEISLDVDMVSAACPRCHILLVEAKTASMANLGAAVKTAVRLGANAVSNSYGGPDAADSRYGRYYHHRGVAITASTGDDGYGVSYPASSKWVTAVGGTSLRRSTNSRGFTETAWSDAGSGCSQMNQAPWQATADTGCDGRAVADVAAVADPHTGVAVYDSDSFDGAAGWLTFGGTSASSPIIAAVYALSGHTGQVKDGSYLWSHHKGLYDIRSGSNGSCPTSAWCHAGAGWDGPTGWGTPDGADAF